MKKSGDLNLHEENELQTRLRGPSQSFVQDEIWLEYLEGESSTSLTADLANLLVNSPADRRELAQFSRVRQAVRQSDDVALPESGHYYDDLHDRIMAAIEDDRQIEASTSSSRAPKTMRDAKFAWPALIGSLTMSLLLVAVGWRALQTPLAGPSKGEQAQFERRDAASDEIDRRLASVSMSESLVGLENESDFVADAAIERLKGLDGRQADEIFARLKSN